MSQMDVNSGNSAARQVTFNFPEVGFGEICTRVPSSAILSGTILAISPQALISTPLEVGYNKESASVKQLRVIPISKGMNGHVVSPNVDPIPSIVENIADESIVV